MGVRCPLAVRPSVANTIGSRVLQATLPAAFHGVGMRAGAIFVPSKILGPGEIQQNCDGDHGFLVTSQA
jgi:hypothetical protein